MPDLIANRPTDVPTRETLGFLISRLPVGAKVLEVGCGEGQVACELVQRGYRVTGLDSDSERIARAQAHGVRAIVASWPKFESSVLFDGIAFTRSLHHINPLRQAIVRARELLNPNGFLLIEDFALDDVDEATVAWFVKVLRSTQGKTLINLVADQLVTELLSATDVIQTWRDNRAHEVHSFTTMNEAIARAVYGARNSVSSVFLSVSDSGASRDFSGGLVCGRSFSTGNYSGKPRSDRVSRSANRGLTTTNEMRHWARVDHFFCSLLFA